MLFEVSHGTNVAKEIVKDLPPEDVEIIPIEFFTGRPISIDVALGGLRKALKTGDLDAINISSLPITPNDMKWNELLKSELRKTVLEYPTVLFSFAAGNENANLDKSSSAFLTSEFLWVAEKNTPKNVALVGSSKCDKSEKSNFSNYGTKVNVYTSGEKVDFILPSGSKGMCSLAGTSFSSPRLINEIIKRSKLRKERLNLVDLFHSSLRFHFSPVDSTPIFTNEDLITPGVSTHDKN